MRRAVEAAGAQLVPEEGAGEAAAWGPASDEAAKIVVVRRQWNDRRAATYLFSDIGGLHWSTSSGGVQVNSPHPFVSGYVWCDAMLSGRLAHSCRHGPPPHHIRVILLKKDNLAIWNDVLALVGPRPVRRKKAKQRRRTSKS